MYNKHDRLAVMSDTREPRYRTHRLGGGGGGGGRGIVGKLEMRHCMVILFRHSHPLFFIFQTMHCQLSLLIMAVDVCVPEACN